MSGKTKIEFYGSSELLKKLESAGANIEQEIVKSIRKSVEKPSDKMLSFMRSKKRTGRTAESWVETVKTKNGVITYEVGFSVRKGGLASIFWEHGTPRKTPPATHFISNAIDQNLDEIIAIQNETLRKAFKELV